MNKQIILKFSFTKNDVVALMFHAMSKRPAIRFMIVGIPIIFLLVFLISIINDAPLPHSIWFLFALIVLSPALLPLVSYISIVKEYNSSPVLKEEREYTIDDNAVSIKSPSFDVTLTWDKFYRMTENKKYFFIWQSQSSAHIIPKSLLDRDGIVFLEEIKQTKFGKK